MTKINLKFAELHAPLFLAGTNLAMKLDPTKRHGLTLTYDRAEKELIVGWAGQEAIVPVSNVASMTAAEAVKVAPVPVTSKTAATMAEAQAEMARRGLTHAQVSTPQSHVHAGPGHGDTGQEKPRGKVVL